MKNFSSSFSFTAITNEPLELCMWNLVRRQTVNKGERCVWIIASKSTNTNMAAMRILEVKFYKFVVNIICAQLKGMCCLHK
jgi:hypothetical protein